MRIEPVTLMGDRDKLRSVVDNLISNAVKYSAAGVASLSPWPAATIPPLSTSRMKVPVSTKMSGTESSMPSTRDARVPVAPSKGPALVSPSPGSLFIYTMAPSRSSQRSAVRISGCPSPASPWNLRLRALSNIPMREGARILLMGLTLVTASACGKLLHREPVAPARPSSRQRHRPIPRRKRSPRPTRIIGTNRRTKQQSPKFRVNRGPPRK